MSKKTYPLSVIGVMEFEGYSYLSYQSKGHHDKEAFCKGVFEVTEGDHNPPVEEIDHLYCRCVPVLDDDREFYGMIYQYTKEAGRGAFPVTVWDKDWHEHRRNLERTELNQKALAEAQ